MDESVSLILKAQKGDEKAKEILIKQNSGLIWSIVKKFYGRGYEPCDLFQIGSIGLLKCIYKFDFSFNVKFSTYAVPMIIGEIKRFMRDDGMIKISRSTKEIAQKAKYIRDKLQNERGIEPSISDLAKELNISVDELIYALESGNEVLSIYNKVYQNDGNETYLVDKLKSKDDETLIDEKIALKEIISTLDKKERQIIVLRYFMDKTQSETAKIIGISQVSVSRCEKKVLNKIRNKL